MSELKQIKRHHERQLKNMDKKLTIYQIHPADVEWLINRVEELEEENDELAERVYKLALDWSELVDERNCYKQALEEENRRYREVINNIIEKAMLFGVDEQVFEAIKEANRVLESGNE